MSDVVIRAENLSKMYKLGVTDNDAFFQEMEQESQLCSRFFLESQRQL